MRSQEYRNIYDDGKGPLFHPTSLSDGIQPPWTKDPMAQRIFSAVSTKTNGEFGNWMKI